MITNFVNSSHGRACISIREDEIAAEAMGINTTKYKVIAFIIGAFCRDRELCMPRLFHKTGFVRLPKSIDILVIVVLGGLEAFPVQYSPLSSCDNFVPASVFPEIRMVIYSVLLIVIMLFRPQGIMGSKELSLSAFKSLGSIFERKNGGER